MHSTKDDLHIERSLTIFFYICQKRTRLLMTFHLREIKLLLLRELFKKLVAWNISLHINTLWLN